MHQVVEVEVEQEAAEMFEILAELLAIDSQQEVVVSVVEMGWVEEGQEGQGVVEWVVMLLAAQVEEGREGQEVVERVVMLLAAQVEEGQEGQEVVERVVMLLAAQGILEAVGPQSHSVVEGGEVEVVEKGQVVVVKARLEEGAGAMVEEQACSS
eukprot:gene13326-13455_t